MYDDFRLKFLIEMVKRIEYFSEADNDILYDIVFNLEIQYFHKYDCIFGERSDIKSILIIEEGIV